MGPASLDPTFAAETHRSSDYFSVGLDLNQVKTKSR